ncbi:hypothetical protein [Aquicella lusitana]|uniref:Uncharacterized protein n=1 Tax=Aquicella lusitana TaxID=254246 RepID=A0A370GQV1_9COXI|nr:hypothetical protein [Aquicella lusitana]RDI46057.1 hypothetical protein C8D86_10661 [Aquicella lusitana]VVC73346.1 hypothetical protein AQULUS_10850 [Aquicella lusitana]
MKIKKPLFLLAAAAGILPAIAHADISVANNTNSYATAHVGFICSSIVNDGVIKPHSSLNISQSIIDLYCVGSCKTDIYMSKNCSGKSVATVSVDQHKGVTGISNHNVNGYYVAGGGYSASVNGGSRKAGLFDWLF